MTWPPLLCVDCLVNVEAELEFCYMVRPELWAAHGARGGYLCVGCIEGRLGRALEPGDFWDVPLNGLTHAQSDRLRSRLGVA